jgi:tetratricopeptide (TPR) repeat protein/tRNA A-37 threonylcarbamoyl transferase component Bud32
VSDALDARDLSDDTSTRDDRGSRSPLGVPAPGPADPEFKQLLRAQLFGAAAEPLRIGRFTVLRQLGAGGMGVVYAAYDDRLDRKVALKLLHRHHGAATESRRLLREAQALARLSHPNVVGVHDVGVWEDRVFVAMEFVHGQTAAAWRAAAPRRWREVVDVYLQAGRGLAAAHAVGLVHGDFKPENVLVGADGRVRVLDFGLARTDLTEAHCDPDPELAARSLRLSVSGALAGTPAYMAPEQLAGARPDARSDQFAFCVALFEALVGRRPFAGADLRELTLALAAGPPASAPGDPAVPGWLRRLVVRGLARDPGARWPTMPALLAALDRQRPHARWLAAAGLGLGLAAASFAALTPARPPLCSDAAAELAGVWDPGRRQALQAAFLRVGTPFAAAAWARTERLLDAHLGAWTDMLRGACEATHVRGTQSTAQLDLRSACLHRRLDEVRALTAVFAAADARVVERAPQAVGLLGSLDACADPGALSSAAPPPADPALRRRVAQLRARLDPVVALQRTGQVEAARARAQALVAEAALLAHPPLVAETLALSGELHAVAGDLRGAEQALQGAVRAGAAARDDDLTARAWVRLVDVVGVGQARFADGLAWARAADVAVVRAGDDPRRRADLLVHEGAILARRGEYEPALARHRSALALQERALPADDPALAPTLDNIGLDLVGLGEYAGAADVHRRALALLGRALGPEHPDLALTHQRLAAALTGFGRHDEAETHARRALAIVRAALPPDHPTAAAVEREAGDAAISRDDWPAARAHYQAALAAQTRALGPDHPDVADAHIGLGWVASFEGRHADALDHGRRALFVVERALGREHPWAAQALDVVGMALEGLGRPGEAVAAFEQALHARELRFGPDHPQVGVSHSNLANAYYKLHRLDDTLAHDLRALEIAERRLGPDHRQLIQRHSNLALVLNEHGRHDAARVHYERAVAIAERAFGPAEPQVAVALTSLGATLLQQDRPADAVPHLERALAVHTARPGEPPDVAFTHFTLGRALWHAGDRRRAHAEVRRARELFTALGDAAAIELAEADRWLAAPEHRLR